MKSLRNYFAIFLFFSASPLMRAQDAEPRFRIGIFSAMQTPMYPAEIERPSLYKTSEYAAVDPLFADDWNDVGAGVLIGISAEFQRFRLSASPVLYPFASGQDKAFGYAAQFDAVLIKSGNFTFNGELTYNYLKTFNEQTNSFSVSWGGFNYSQTTTLSADMRSNNFSVGVSANFKCFKNFYVFGGYSFGYGINTFSGKTNVSGEMYEEDSDSYLFHQFRGGIRYNFINLFSK